MKDYYDGWLTPERITRIKITGALTFCAVVLVLSVGFKGLAKIWLPLPWILLLYVILNATTLAVLSPRKKLKCIGCNTKLKINMKRCPNCGRRKPAAKTKKNNKKGS